MRREPVFTLPNLVSMSRFAMAVAFLATPMPDARVALIGAASLSDVLDGWIARRRHEVTRIGAILDPIADRTFMLTAVAVFLATGRITRPQYFVLLARDIMTAIGFLVAKSVSWLRVVPFRARWAGKLVTTLQLLALIAVLVAPREAPWVIGAVGVASVIAISDYTLALWHAREPA
ncbi:MAG TPA: CDP-alcohol phosphatidyltransferase family protein [Gemmatimonadaceae bacterium]|jgi:cardiolipin synthase|nr:CDP-alcohol phosphatidyltransferase family protein [Gemmatimonadaceae bacterium]